MVSRRKRLRRYFSMRQISLRVTSDAPWDDLNSHGRQTRSSRSRASGFGIGLNIEIRVADELIHGLRRPIATRTPYHLRRHAGHGAMRRHGLQNNRARTHARIFPDFDIAEHLGAHREQYAAPDLGMTVASLLARAAKRHAVQHRDIVFDDSRLADHDAGRMVHENPTADTRRRMNVHREQFRDPALP